MKLLVISTNIFPLPPSGYSGLEMLVYNWAVEFQKAGHQVSVVAPTGSQLPEGMELIATNLGEGEDASWGRYKDRLMKGDWDAVFDNSWTWMSALSQMEADRLLPVIHCYHSDPYNLGAPPPIANPCIVAFSEAQANIMRRKWNCAVRVVHHGIDLDFYKPDPNVQQQRHDPQTHPEFKGGTCTCGKGPICPECFLCLNCGRMNFDSITRPRGNRFLFLARYTPEKGFLEIAHLAKKCKVGLDAFGDVTIISSQDYANKCFQESDGRQIRVMPGIPRQETVKQYQIHKALITWPNFVEIFGLTTVECMACGTPVISKDSGAARELIVEGKTGFVVGTLEEAEELIKTDALSQIKPEDCRKQAEKFSIQKSAQGHLKCLQDVASGVYW